MSFGWAFLIYLFIGLIARLILVVFINYKAKKNKDLGNDYQNVLDNLDDLVENSSQQYDNPQNFRFVLMLLGYVLWPLDLLGFMYFLFPPKE